MGINRVKGGNPVQFEAIMDALPMAVLVCDRHGQVMFANRAVKGLVGPLLDDHPLAELAAELDQEGFFDSPTLDQSRRRVVLSRDDGSRVTLEALVSTTLEQDQAMAVVVLEPAASPALDALADRRGSVAVPTVRRDPPRRARLLVVDDEEMVRMVICAVLNQKGYETVEAVDGKDALSKCVEGTFDLALVDLFMPRLNGLETLQQLRRVQPQLRALLLSGVADIREFKEWDSLAEVTFLQKPFDNQELTRAVEELLAAPR